MLHYDRRTLQNAVKNILDGELLNKYLYLSTMERSELAKKIGTTSDIVSAALNVSNALQHVWHKITSESNIIKVEIILLIIIVYTLQYFSAT